LKLIKIEKLVKHFELSISNSKLNVCINKEKPKIDRNIINNINLDNKQNKKIKLEKEKKMHQYYNNQNIFELNIIGKNKKIINEKEKNKFKNNNIQKIENNNEQKIEKNNDKNFENINDEKIENNNDEKNENNIKVEKIENIRNSIFIKEKFEKKKILKLIIVL
jgi:hypothetical protein